MKTHVLCLWIMLTPVAILSLPASVSPMTIESAADVRPDADLPAHIPPHNAIIDYGEGMWWPSRPLLHNGG
jgi:hypothetical protein